MSEAPNVGVRRVLHDAPERTVYLEPGRGGMRRILGLVTVDAGRVSPKVKSVQHPGCALRKQRLEPSREPPGVGVFGRCCPQPCQPLPFLP